ncbi:MAG: glycoside hydrolase family 3 N-terminal domain-containing protein [Cyclobacteriaceae bacterium]
MSDVDLHIDKIELPIEVSVEARSWAREVLNGLTLDEKIGQLIHIATWSNRPEDHQQEVESIIKKYGIGGLIFFQGTPEKQATMTNEYQSLSKVPLMISIDGEWGLGMRLEGAEPFPYQMTLGAVQDVDLIDKMGKAVARQMKRIGVNLNHAPVVDVNTNPQNPVINFRSFGQSKEAVTERGAAYMQGMQSEGVLACAKHFPGHGDTSADSHKELPYLDKSKEDLKSTELYPFVELMKKGLGAMMIAHLQIPQLEPEPNRASTLSREIVQQLLKQELGFQGLVVTDALDMRAVADHYAPGKVDVEALLAGNDVLLFVKSVPSAIAEIKAAIKAGKISENEIEGRVFKQLLFKHWMGLSGYAPITLEKINEEVNTHTRTINEALYKASLTFLGEESALAIKSAGHKTALISLYADGDKIEGGALSHHTLLKGNEESGGVPLFEKELADEIGPDLSQHTLRFDEITARKQEIIQLIASCDQVVLAIHDVKLKAPENFGITPEMINFIDQLLQEQKTHLVFFGNPYALSSLNSISAARSILLTYQENKYTHKYAAQALLGKYKPQGKLPVDINKRWCAGSGL